MATRTQAPPGGYLWEVPGAAVAVHLDSAVIDDLRPEMMRAFRAVPKRGAEVGGLLLGEVEPSAGPDQLTLVRVNSFELVPCVYARGPSYLLTGEESAAFEQACERLRAEASRHSSVVGYFRSHTRPGLSLSPEDLDILNRHFPNSFDIALLIRPFASQPAQAGFFFREQGAFQEQTPLVFPFSRLEPEAETKPEPEAAPAPSPLSERKRYRGSPRRLIPLPDEEELAPSPAAEEKPLEAQFEPQTQLAKTTPEPRSRSLVWGWVAVAFLFLLIGAMAGFEVSQILPGRIPVAGLIPIGAKGEFSVALHVVPAGDGLNVRWDPGAPAIRSAQSGVLQIEDGDYSEHVDLDSAHLRNGELFYRSSSPSVRFRLTVYEGARVSVTETVDWPH
ncbi:MAG TPA: hypothetical protein VIY49_31090 [Bryobacteraceae bacterium]